MYSVGIFANISELTTFPFANIKVFAEEKFSSKENYNFTLYTKEQKELFIALVQTGQFDGIVFATNTANDAMLQNYFESNVAVFSRFLSLGGGILVLLQYHLAIAEKSFNILSETDFPGLVSTRIVTRQNNDKNNSPMRYDNKAIQCHGSNIIFSYPLDILNGEKSLFSSMERNKWQTGSTPLFACIKDYPESDFFSIMDYKTSSVDDAKNRQESFCIVSRNPNKRVIFTTLAPDLEENFLLENFISYIAKGEPSVFFKSCDKCGDTGETCDLIDLLNSTKIHFSDVVKIKNLVKYEICNCTTFNETGIKQKDDIDRSDSIIPIKQLLPIADSGCVSRSISVSAVKYICKLGAQYLRTQLSGGKYGSLIGTLSTLQLFKRIGVSVTIDDKKSIIKYLTSHNRDKKTFDAIKESTNIAHQILELLDCPEDKNSFVLEDTIGQIEIGAVDITALDARLLNDIAKMLGRSDKTIDEIVSGTEKHIKEFLLKVFAKIISSRDVGKISWENDCYMTSLMLIVLLRIEEWFSAYDKKNNTNCVAKINIITSYFEEVSETSLYNALVSNADAEREKAHAFSTKLLDEKESNKKLVAEMEKLTDEKRDFEAMENKVRRHQTFNIILTFTLVALILFFIIVVLKAQYSHENIYEFIMNLQPIGLVLSLAGVIVIPFTIGAIYWRSKKPLESKPKRESKFKKLLLKIGSILTRKRKK